MTKHNCSIHTKCFSDSREKRDASREKQDASREKQDASQEKQDLSRKFMYQYRSGLLPNSFNNMFSVTHQVHSYGTRSSEFFHLPQCRTNMRKFSISFQGPKFLILIVLNS